jgi:hypothetical protein
MASCVCIRPRHDGSLSLDEVARHVRERSRKAQETLERQHGIHEIAVDLIRQGREE